jgi:hypothetical protein
VSRYERDHEEITTSQWSFGPATDCAICGAAPCSGVPQGTARHPRCNTKAEGASKHDHAFAAPLVPRNDAGGS